MEETLDGWGSDEAGTTGCRDELVNHQHLVSAVETAHGTYPDGDRATLAALLGRQRVRITERCSPVSSPDRQDAQLGDDDGGADGGGYLLRGFDPETDVAF